MRMGQICGTVKAIQLLMMPHIMSIMAVISCSSTVDCTVSANAKTIPQLKDTTSTKFSLKKIFAWSRCDERPVNQSKYQYEANPGGIAATSSTTRQESVRELEKNHIWKTRS